MSTQLFKASERGTANFGWLNANYSFSFANSWDSIHDVQGYTRNDGTYVKEHRAGNPNSGVHCQDNICD